MHKLENAELEEALSKIPGWSLTDGKLQRKWTFPDFASAMAFVNKVAQVAEKEGHHPDIDIRYNVVTLGLVTHDAGGITDKDADLATLLNCEL